MITGERGETTLTRHGLEEYVTDAVIQLDHRVHEQISTRRIRVVKYRGSHHGTNEYPFLIDADGINVLPVTSLTLQHDASSERVSSGLERLDEMLGGQGYYRGSTVLITGTAGTGKTTLGGAFRRRRMSAWATLPVFPVRRVAAQMIRNMRAAGIDLEPWVNAGPPPSPCRSAVTSRAGDASGVHASRR